MNSKVKATLATAAVVAIIAGLFLLPERVLLGFFLCLLCAGPLFILWYAFLDYFDKSP